MVPCSHWLSPPGHAKIHARQAPHGSRGPWSRPPARGAATAAEAVRLPARGACPKAVVAGIYVPGALCHRRCKQEWSGVPHHGGSGRPRVDLRDSTPPRRGCCCSARRHCSPGCQHVGCSEYASAVPRTACSASLLVAHALRSWFSTASNRLLLFLACRSCSAVVVLDRAQSSASATIGCCRCALWRVRCRG